MNQIYEIKFMKTYNTDKNLHIVRLDTNNHQINNNLRDIIKGNEIIISKDNVCYMII